MPIFFIIYKCNFAFDLFRAVGAFHARELAVEIFILIPILFIRMLRNVRSFFFVFVQRIHHVRFDQFFILILFGS